MAAKPPTAKMIEILVAAAADPQGNAQKFTRTDSQGQSLKARGLTAYDATLRQMVITEAGRAYVASL